jgi:ribosome-binding protein aMBF1 (putative translation factor)
MKTHDELVKEWMEDPDFKREYDELEAEFSLFDELLKARQEAGLTQAEVAERMGTKASAIARLEAGGGNSQLPPPKVVA